MFWRTQSNFDVAPPRPGSLTRGALVLLLGLAVLGVCGWRYYEVSTRLAQLQSAEAEVRASQMRRVEAANRAALARQSPEELRRAHAHQQVQRLATNAWFDLLATLEGAARELQSGVSVVSLTPSRSAGQGTDIRIAALAASEELMLEYLRLLRVDSHVALAELVSQEPEVQATGKPIVRFQMNVRWKEEALVLPGQTASAGPTAPGTPTGKWE